MWRWMACGMVLAALAGCDINMTNGGDTLVRPDPPALKGTGEACTADSQCASGNCWSETGKCE